MALDANSTTAPGIPRAHATDERFAIWWASVLSLDARVEALPSDDEDAVAALMAERHVWEGHIGSHAVTGPGGVLIKARLLHSTLRANLEPFMASLAADVVSHLEASQ